MRFFTNNNNDIFKHNLHFKNLDKKRLEEILKVFSKYGFDFFNKEFELKTKNIFSIKNYNSNSKKLNKLNLRDLDYNFEEKFRLILEELGPSFIKLGQTLSTRPDLVGDNLSKELTKLLDKTKEIPFFQIKKILEKDLGSDYKNIFKEFSEKPIASASIAQVYKAKLKKIIKIL